MKKKKYPQPAPELRGMLEDMFGQERHPNTRGQTSKWDEQKV